MIMRKTHHGSLQSPRSLYPLAPVNQQLERHHLFRRYPSTRRLGLVLLRAFLLYMDTLLRHGRPLCRLLTKSPWLVRRLHPGIVVVFPIQATPPTRNTHRKPTRSKTQLLSRMNMQRPKARHCYQTTRTANPPAPYTAHTHTLTPAQ